MSDPTHGTKPPAPPSTYELLAGMIAGLTVYMVAIVAVWAADNAKGDAAATGLGGWLDRLYPAADALSTMAFAISGAYTVAVAARKCERPAWSLVATTLAAGVVTGVGGGIVRDLVFLMRVPVVTSNPALLTMATLGSLLGLMLSSQASHLVTAAIDSADYAAVGLMGVFGFTLAHKVAPGAAAPAAHCIASLVAAVTSCGGGFVRDIVRRERPFALIGCYLPVSLAAAGIHATIYSVVTHWSVLAQPEEPWALTVLVVTGIGLATGRIVF